MFKEHHTPLYVFIAPGVNAVSILHKEMPQGKRYKNRVIEKLRLSL